jgi:sulfoxide reductase heme-binding subunit YedZ
VTRRRLTVAATVAALVLNAALFVLAAGSGDVFWQLDRSSGEVTLALVTCVVVLGVVRAGRPASNAGLVEGLHVDLALLTIAFAATHVASTILGAHTSLGPVDALVPFVAAYRGTWVGVGVVSGYLYLVTVLTSWPLRRLPRAWWTWLHRTIYLAWVLGLAHAVGAGSDARSAAYAGIDVLAVGGVLVALLAIRWRRRGRPAASRELPD